MARFRITPEKMVTEPANPLIYGNILESGFGRQVEGM
jgi:hypothetical protein